MNLHDLVSQVIADTKGISTEVLIAPNSSLALFAPEIVLSLTIVLLLFVRLFPNSERVPISYVALAGLLLATYLAAPWQLLAADAELPRREIFTGMLVYDSFSIFIRGILLGFAALFVLFLQLSRLPLGDDRVDVLTLVLGATLGLCLMTSANHLLMVFMGIEMASVPSYAMAGLLRRDRRGSEAAMKFAVYGAGAAGVMLYGISLIAGLVNSVHIPTVAIQLSERFAEGMPPNEMMVAALGGLMIAAGMAYKLSAVPFHYWAPDVFEGACAEVGAFLSISSKAAAMALLVRLAIGFGTISPVLPTETTETAEAVTAETTAGDPAAATHELVATDGLYSVEDSVSKTETSEAEANVRSTLR